MSLDLSYSYCTRLSKNEQIAINLRVYKNRQGIYIFVKNLPSNAKNKTKRLLIVSSLGVAFLFSNVEASQAIGLSIPPVPMVRVQPSYQKALRTPIMVPNCIDSNSIRLNKKILLLIYFTDTKIYSNNPVLNEQILKVIKELRGGTLMSVLLAGALIGMVIMVFTIGMSDSVFVRPSVGQGWGLERPNVSVPPPYYYQRRPGSTLEVNRPPAMPNEQFLSLSKEQRRQLTHINDMKIIHEGYPELSVGFWQAKHKVSDHGAIHNLPYTLKNNGKTKTEKPIRIYYR